jgi:hypothetical protein
MLTADTVRQERNPAQGAARQAVRLSGAGAGQLRD